MNKPIAIAPMNKNRKMPNSTWAMVAEAYAMTVNPKMPAMIALIRKMTAHFSMLSSLLVPT